MLQFGLRKDGYLFLGSSETIIEKSAFMEEVNKKWKIYKILERRRNVNFDVFSPPLLIDSQASSLSSIKYKEPKNKTSGLKEFLNETIIAELGYTGVCSDKHHRVLQTFGDVSQYLLPKMFNLDLGSAMPKSLFTVFKNAEKKAFGINKKVTVNGIRIKNSNNIIITLNLTLIPFNIDSIDEKLMLVLFKEGSFSKDLIQPFESFNENLYANEYITNLEKELKESSQKLEDVYEKLDASNENMQSFNEELLSTNEEMQSTNEEMQSVNEELHTINAEYQLKIKELSDLNDDLNNYFRSNENGQLFINKKMQLMKFSPGAVKHINLQESDIGRPISNLSSNIKNATLEEDAGEVINSGKVITKEVEAVNGKWYQMMTMPYLREKDNKIDGVIITFNDITALKKAQTELDKTNKTLTEINGDLDNFVYTASHDLLGPITNIEQIIMFLREKEGEFNEEINEYHRLLGSSVYTFKSIIKDLAVVGRIESEIFDVDPIDLRELIKEITASMQGKLHSAKAHIYTDLHITGIRFSKKNLRSIIYNLINNAVKFRSPEREPQIHILAEAKEGYSVLSVKDNGLGIPKEKIGNIFRMYTRIHQNIEGQGIGLYLIKKIIDATGGKVVVESEVDKGSNFQIFFKL